MQQSNEERRSGRPSLLGEPGEEVDKPRILNRLDGGKRAGRPGMSASGRLVIAATLLLCGGAVAWQLQDDSDAPAAAQAARTPIPASAQAGDSQAMPVAAETMAATILEPDVEVLSPPSRPRDEPAALPQPHALPALISPPTRKASPVLQGMTEPIDMEIEDNSSAIERDETLLAALLAHAKPVAPRTTITVSEYKRCATLPSVAESDACRVRLCAGSARPSECASP